MEVFGRVLIRRHNQNIVSNISEARDQIAEPYLHAADVRKRAGLNKHCNSARLLQTPTSCTSQDVAYWDDTAPSWCILTTTMSEDAVRMAGE